MAEEEAPNAVVNNIDDIRKKELEKLKELYATRNAVDSINSKFIEQKEQWEKEHANEIVELNKGKEDIALIETELRDLALADYDITKEKKLTGGLGIKIMKKLEYEPDKAFNWAEKHGIGLELNKRAFESFVKSQEKDLKKAKLDFVSIKEKATATIPKCIEGI